MDPDPDPEIALGSVASVALFLYSHEQGFSKRQLKIGDLFHPSTLELTDES